MGIVNINLRGINYKVACQDGEEERLMQLADKFTKKFDKLTAQMPKSSDTHLLLMTGLLLQDELAEIKEKGLTQKEIKEEVNNSVAEAVIAIAEYVETLADKIENSYN